MANLTDEIKLLFRTSIDDKDLKEVSQNLKNALGNAAIGFDEAEIKRNVEPIIRMVQKLFDKADIKFNADELLAMPGRQALQKMSEMGVDQLQIAFDRALQKSGGIKIDFGDIDLSSMTEPLEKLTQELSEIGERVASTTKKSVQDIEKSLKSLDKAKKLDKTVSGIEKTLGVVNSGKSITSATKATTQLEKAREAYSKSVTDNDPWEVQYQHLLTFVSRYEAMTKKIKPIIDTDRPEFKQLYELLSPKAGAAKISLEHFVDVARGNELTEYKNQPWARESTLKKVERALSNGITVKDGGGNNKDNGSSDDSPKPTATPANTGSVETKDKKLNTKVSVNDSDDADKAAREALAQKQRIITQKIEETERQIEENNKRIADIEKDIAAKKTIKAYKGVGIDEGEEAPKSRKVAYQEYKADYYATEPLMAQSYASGDEAHVVVAEITPKVYLEFDTQDFIESGDYEELLGHPDFIAAFREKLIEHVKSTVSSKSNREQKIDEIQNLDLSTDSRDLDANQLVMNEAAKDVGFDSIILNNILDYTSNSVEGQLEGERDSVKRKLGSTIAVLTDDILEVIGFQDVMQTDKGPRLSAKVAKKKPWYYKMPTFPTEDGRRKYKPVADPSEDLQKKIELESEVVAIEKSNKQLQKELDTLRSEVKNIGVSNNGVEPHNEARKDISQVSESQQVEKEAESHKENTAAIKEEVKVTEELAAAKEQAANASDPSEELKESQKIISVQKQWLEYLDNILNDDKFKTNGKRAATEQLSSATKALVDYRRHPDEYAGEEMRGDKLVVMWNKAYEEAKKQGVAQSTLTRNYTDAVDMYADALERLQAQQRFLLQTIAEEEAKINALQYPAQDDTTVHKDNTAAIVAETQAQKELNEEKSKSLLPTADGLEAHTYAPSNEQKAYVLKLGEEYRVIMEILERGDSEFEAALIERANAIQHIMLETVRGNDGDLVYEYQNVYGGPSKTATSLGDWRQSDELLRDVDSNKIDDSQRRAAIDLIYQELEAEKQLDAERLKAREAAKQREVDTFQSKYSSASEEEKKLLYEIIELDKEQNRLYDIGDEESHKAALAILEKVREKENALEKLNAELMDAYDDVGFKRAGPYIETPSAVSHEINAIPVDTSAEQMQLINLKGSVDDVTGAVNAKTEAFKAEGIEVGKVVDGEIEKLGTLEKKISTIKETLEGLLSNIKNGADDVGTGLSNIIVNVNHKKEEDGESTVSINQDSLKSTLEQIVYKVKIAHDDNDKQANKIAIDEGILENVLKRVTYNVNLANDEKQDDKVVSDKDTTDQSEENKQETDNTVRQLRDNIAPKMEDAKAKSVEVAPVGTDVGNVLATENTLEAIKTAVEAINSKIVKGTKAKTSGGGKKKTGVGKKNAEDYVGSQYFPEKLKTQAMYLAKFRAQLMTTGKLTDDVDAQIYELLDALSQVKNGPDFSRWNQQFLQLKTSVGIADIFEDAEDKEVAASYKEIIELQKLRNKLELDYEKAEDGSAVKQFYADQLAQMDQAITKQQIILDNEEYEMKLVKIRTEQARKLGELEAKAADRDAKMRAEQERKLMDEKSKQSEKDAKKQAANAKRMAQREAMLGKAGNAVGRAENTWMSAAGIEGELPADFVAEIDNYYQKLDELRKKHQELKNSDMISDEQKNELIAQTMSVNKMTEEIGALVAEYQKLSGDNATVIGTNTLNSDAGLGAYEQQLKQAVTTATNGKAQIKNFDAATKTLTYTVKTGKNEFTEYTAAVRRADGALVSVQGTTKRTETFLEATARKMKELTSYFSGMAVFNQIGQELRRGIQYVREIDLALTELKKVTDETEETYDRFLETAAKTADKVGSTIQKVVSSTADWARLGYSMKEAAEFAESTQILMNVSEFTDVSQATDTLISAVQAFGYTAETSMNVVDLLNTIGNNYAISTADLAQSLTKSSASLVAAGGDLAEAAALTATANAIIQDADSVGTALKTTSLRLRGTSVEELEKEGVDSDGAVESTSKLQSKIKALSGVDILTETGEYKSTYQILSQIADVWADINDMDQAALLELLAGKRNASVLAAILQAPEDLKAAYEDAQNAEGSALKENERYLDSIQGKIDQFNNAMQAMWGNTLDSDMVKGFVSLGTEIVQIIDKIGLLNGALLAFGAYKGFGMVFGTLKDAGISVEFLTKKLGSYLFGIQATSSAEARLTQVELQNKLVKQGLTEENAKAIIAQTGLGVSTDKLSRETFEATMNELGYDAALVKTTADKIFGATATNASTGALIQETIQRKLQNSALVEYAISMKLATAADVGKMTTTQLLGLSFKALGVAVWGATKAIVAFLFTNPVGWLILAIGAIVGGIAAWNKWGDTTENLTERLEDLKSEISDMKSELESLNSELEITQDRMEELLSKDSLSFTEEEELKNLQLQNELLEKKIKLQEMLLKNKIKEANRESEELINREWNGTKLDKKYAVSYYDGGSNNGGAAFIKEDDMWSGGVSGKEALEIGIQSYIDRRNHSAIEDNLYSEVLKMMEENDGKLNDELISRVESVLDYEQGWFDEQYGNVLVNGMYNDDAGAKNVAEHIKSTLEGSREINEEALRKQETGIEMVLGDLLKQIPEDYEYGTSDIIDQAFDELTAYQLKYENAQGTANKSEIINTIFGAGASEELQLLEEELQEIASSEDDVATKTQKAQSLIQQAYESTNEGYKRLKNSIDIVDISVEELARSFIVTSEAADLGTIGGVLRVFAGGEDILKDFKNGVTETWDSLFTEVDGNKVADNLKVADILKGADEDIRNQFTKLIEAIEDEKMGVDEALSKWRMAGIDKAVEALNTEFEALNNEMFPDAADEISGLIDTLSELKSAFESVANTMDTFESAQEEYSNTGRVSIQTALELMSATDDWDKILNITEDSITLVDGAEKALMETQLESIAKQTQTAADLAKSKWEAAVQAQNAKAAFDEEAGAANNLNTAEQNVSTTQQNATLTTQQRTGAMGDLAVQTYGTAISELDYADNDDTVQTAEAVKAKAIGLVSAAIVGLDSFIDALLTDKTIGEAWAEYQEARDVVVADADSKTTTVGALAEDYKKKQALAKVAANGSNYDDFNKNWENSDKDGDGIDDEEEDAIQDGWEKLLAKYENQLALITNERDLIQGEIDKAEARGGKASTKYYEDLIRNSNDEKTLLEQKKTALEAYLAANAGAIDQDTWTEYNNEINETAVAIKECEVNTIEWEEAIREIDLHYFEQITDEVSRLGEELDFVNSLLEDEEVADENGNWSSAALTRMGLYTQQIEKAATEAAMYQDEIDKVNEQYKAGALSEEQYQERLSDLVSGQQDAIQSYEDAKDSIVEMNEARIDVIKEGIEKEIEAYEDLIDAKKEELGAERDLYDFKKNVKNQTKDIAELERRIASLSGSSAASDVAERRRLEAQLAEAKEGLNDTYYEHSQDARSAALDEESEAYTLSKERYIEQLEEQLKDTETLISNSIMDVMFNADTVYNELIALSDTYGGILSDELTQPWKDASDQAIEWKAELSRQLSASELALITHESGPVTAFANGVATKLEGTWARVETAAQNYAGYLTGAELKNKFTNTLTGFGTQIQSIIDKWDGVKAAADAAYAAQTRTATVGGNEISSGFIPTPYVEDTNNAGDVGAVDYSSSGTEQTTELKELTEAQKMVPLITRFGSAQGSGMNAGKKGDNGIVTWNGREFAVQNSGTTFGKNDDLYKAAVTHLKFRDRQIFGYRGGVYGYLDGVIQQLEGRTLSKKGYNALVAYASGQYTSFAKGTTGTTRDQWAITDESWIGEEITLAAGKSGRLRGMMKGSAVLPSDISENLVEWGKISPDEARSGNIVNNNYVNAPTNDVDVENSLTIDGKNSSTQDVHDSIRGTYELIENTVKNIDSVSQHYKPSVDEALTTPWVDAAVKVDEFNEAANANYDGVISHIDENKESLEIALNTPYTNVTDDVNDFSQHAQKASVDDVIKHATEQSPALTTALSTGFNNAKTAADALKTSGTSAVNAVKDSFTNAKTGLIKALNDTTSAAQKTKQAIDNVPTHSGASDSSSASVQAGQHYISSLGKNVTLSSNVVKWGSVATQALQKTGQYSYDNLLLLLHQMQTESSGNQNAINNWDINAKNGTPSKGLMQVIDPTFQAYAMKGYDKDIYDPLSNIIAAIRYTTSRYGSLSKGWRGSGYAKGTTGTSKDEWALTDEFGPELTMYATPDGTLSFMRAGSTVIPADITANLVEWGKLNPNMLNVNGAPNFNMISNAVNKPELNITFDSLIRAENVTEETLPAVKKLVTQELNRFTKELNYALKGKGAR